MNRLQKWSLVVAVAGLGAAATSTAVAFHNGDAGHQVNIEAYSDASHTTLVGVRSYGDCGAASSWGQMSNYTVETFTECQHGPVEGPGGTTDP